ncbi:NitT/TauT family transport system ATP-binding protein [Rhodopseudomonas thermotolerans]|uniref:NitT/TauT family transport system ATP-binding protein n=2 Tax=Rhodopseudomonas TaxID=1073 RepID=A0A336JXI0_9BRAD|nr:MULTISPECIES: ATP-binding cassette domain-containing protein [Rhodopseudomonas]RED26065.1 NitT/TauT family transport system ATP-binding protein [Rhodopseudomonas pentothenatexigens]REF91026.1 NitT/TauT family transport system ATP-binding protein [Rhodopseudomonas thermotolerans]SSW92989.1 NitT/TauT family transport system ATP-binding protein [Rhodopseudomonas pentothenatexigens]
MSEPVLQFRGVQFGYQAAPVLRGIDFDVEAGSITAVMGPSGSGKSTLMALAAGLLMPDAGAVHRCSTRLGMVFQDPALLPWRTALDNVAFPLIALGLQKRERRERARAMLANVGLSGDDAGKYPRQLSGGMRQRVALARALVIEPDLLLCDEPFSALDALVRAELWRILRGIHARSGLTMLIVTHDGPEAMQCDHLAILSAGHIEQFGTPAEIAHHPVSDVVRTFVAASTGR